jgi:hypothetical protein
VRLRGCHIFAVEFDACHLAGADRIENSGPVRGQLKGVAVAAGDEYGAATPFFFCRGRGEEVVSLEARRLGILKTAGRYKSRNGLKLLDNGVFVSQATTTARGCSSR